MNNSDHAHTILTSTFGFDKYREGQQDVIEKLLDDRSTLAVFPTGGGKSLCYQLPALLFDGLTIVVSPLIALMKDQIDFLESRDVAAARLDSTLSPEEASAVWQRLRAGDLKLLYMAPERFGNEHFLAGISNLTISMMVVDEAHCISEWGHNFRPDYLRLEKIAANLGVETILALTATATPQVADDIRKSFAIAEEDYVNTGFHRPNLFLQATPVTACDKDALLLKRINERPRGTSIVYVTTQRTAEEVAASITAEGIPAKAYHAGLDGATRHAVQDWFMTSENAVVAATVAFGMGIDKPDIRYVYHYNLPKSLENYAQETGRSGRDGDDSTCEMFVSASDATILENFAYANTPSPQSVHGLVHDVLEQPETFALAFSETARRFDMPVIAVETLLCYLELESVIAPTGAFYDEFKVQFTTTRDDVLQSFDQTRSDFLRALFSSGNSGPKWLTIAASDASQRLAEPRDRIAAALGHLETCGAIVLQNGGLKHGYRRVGSAPDGKLLADTLARRFQAAQQRDLQRVQEVLELGDISGCLTRRVLRHFGEELGKRCGHCDRCEKRAIPTVSVSRKRPLGLPEREDLLALLAESRPELARPQQLARFLCGLPPSPAGRVTAKLRCHRMFGKWSRIPLPDAVDFVDGQVPAA